MRPSRRARRLPGSSRWRRARWWLPRRCCWCARLALVVAWLWLPGLRRRRVNAALGWLAAAGALAAVLAGLIGTRQAWLDYRAWDLLGTGQNGVSFSWDQSYGPITWSRSQRTMFV